MAQLTTNSTAVPNSTTTEGHSEGAEGLLQVHIILGFLVLLGFLIVCINSFVIYLVAKKNRLKTVTNFCLASMAVSDMLTGLVIIPLIVVCNVGPPSDMVWCLAMDLGQRFLSISTILHLLLITLERYITIVYMFHSNSLFGKRSCVLILLALWGFSLMADLIQLAFQSEEGEVGRAAIIYDIVLLVGIVALPLLVMAFAYGHIFYTLKRHCKQIKRDISHLADGSANRYRQKERKAITIYVTMLVVFVIGWFNYFLKSLRDDLGVEQTPLALWADTLLMFLRFSTSLFNPILYTFLKHDFKRARKSIRFCPCLEDYSPVASNSKNRGDTMVTASAV